MDHDAYPGAKANASQLLHLAEQYRSAAHSLLQQVRTRPLLSSAPSRLLAIHAIELYLNALLLHKGHGPQEIRGMRHDLSARALLAASKGLALRKLTQAHLATLVGNREYLVLRYEPEWKATVSQINRLTATLDELAKKTISIIQL